MSRNLEITYGGKQTAIQVSQQSATEYAVGDSATMNVTVDDALVRAYADQYGDRNPIHLDEAAGRASLFGARIAHGMLTFNFFSTLLASFPGPGTIFTGVQDWKFTAPVLIGDVLAVEVRVSAARRKGNGSYDLSFDAVARNPKGKAVMSGKLGVIAPPL